MSEIDGAAVFRIPGFAAGKAGDFSAISGGGATSGAEVGGSVVGEAASVVGAAVMHAADGAALRVAPVEELRVEATGLERSAVGAMVVPKLMPEATAGANNFYEELTAISEEILECRSKILETC